MKLFKVYIDDEDEEPEGETAAPPGLNKNPASNIIKISGGI